MDLDNSAFRYLEVLTKEANQVVFAYEIAANRFAYLNPAFEKVWCKTRKSIQDHPHFLFNMIHPEDQNQVQRQYRELLRRVLNPKW